MLGRLCIMARSVYAPAMKGFILTLAALGWVASGEFAAAQGTAKKAAAGARPTARTSARKSVPKKRTYKPGPKVDPTLGDNVDGDDLAVRRAAVEALGTVNGSVVVVDPTNGRVLTVVNQKLAFQG